MIIPMMIEADGMDAIQRITLMMRGRERKTQEIVTMTKAVDTDGGKHSRSHKESRSNTYTDEGRERASERNLDLMKMMFTLMMKISDVVIKMVTIR